MARGRWRTDQTVRRYTHIWKVQMFFLDQMLKANLELYTASRAVLHKVFAGRRLPFRPHPLEQTSDSLSWVCWPPRFAEGCCLELGS